MELDADCEPPLTGPREVSAKQAFFTTDELAAAWDIDGRVLERRLGYHVQTRDLVRIRRGLYASNHCDWDEYFLARRLAKDGVIAYGTALAFHALLPRPDEFIVAAARSAPSFYLGGSEFRVVRNPLPPESALLFTEEHDYWGETVRVTSLARTLVDCLDRLDDGPGFVGTLEAFVAKPELPINLHDVVDYARMLGSGVAAARAAACLWAHPNWSTCTTDHQAALARLAPRRTRYATPGMGKGDGTYFKCSALVVPHALYSIAYRRK